MQAKQKLIPAITFLIVLCALFVSGCKYPVSLPETDDVIAEDSLQVTDSVAEVTGRKPLTLIFTNLAPSKSRVNVVFYQTKHKFLSKTDRLKGYKFNSNGSTLTTQVKDLSYGEFAIAFYQDVNNDGKCDRNFMGIPQEPYGFSNNFKPKLKPPGFGDCKFTYSEKENTLNLSMLR
ncbi:MAG: DUF2141 domain-containing protein [Chitinophagales bacterium]|nr:DUF2141 domain-containing protein [Chitinophagales bacterium]